MPPTPPSYCRPRGRRGRFRSRPRLNGSFAVALALLVCAAVLHRRQHHLFLLHRDVLPFSVFAAGAARSAGPISADVRRLFAASSADAPPVALHTAYFAQPQFDGRAPPAPAVHDDIITDLDRPWSTSSSQWPSRVADEEGDDDDDDGGGGADDVARGDSAGLSAPLMRNLSVAAAPVARQAAGCADGRIHYVELAIAFDSTFCALHGSDPRLAKAAVQELVLTANRAYIASTCVRLALVHVDAQCDKARDPYARMFDFSNCRPPGCSQSRQLLEAFRKFWTSQRAGVARDVAFLLSGGGDATSVAGVAGLGGACSRRSGYGWVEGSSVYTLAHEIGHTLGATHSRLGLMRAVTVGNDRLDFSPFSARQINRFVDNYASARCMRAENPRCDDTCPARCRARLCVLPRPPGPGQVACSPTNQVFRCAVQKVPGQATGVVAAAGATKRFFGVECDAQLNVALRKYNPNDLTMFCCAKPTRTALTRVVPRDYRFLTLVTRSGAGQFVRTPNFIANANDIRTVTLASARIEECRNPTPPAAAQEQSPERALHSRSAGAQKPSGQNRSNRRGKRSYAKHTSVGPTITDVKPSVVLGGERTHRPKTCGATFHARLTMGCTEPRFFGTLTAGSVGKVTVLAQQQWGALDVRLHAAAPGTRLAGVAVRASMYRNLRLAFAGPPATVRATTGVVSRRLSVSGLKVPAGLHRCCFKPLTLYVRVRLCRGQTCALGETRMTREILCRNACAIDKRVVPMSKTQKCPRCA